MFSLNFLTRTLSLGLVVVRVIGEVLLPVLIIMQIPGCCIVDRCLLLLRSCSLFNVVALCTLLLRGNRLRLLRLSRRSTHHHLEHLVGLCAELALLADRCAPLVEVKGSGQEEKSQCSSDGRSNVDATALDGAAVSTARVVHVGREERKGGTQE